MLSLLGEVRQEPGSAREDRDCFRDRRVEAEVEQHCRDRHRHVQRERCKLVAKPPRVVDMGPAHAALVGKLEDPLGPRIDRTMNRVSEARHSLQPGDDSDPASLRIAPRLPAAAHTPRTCPAAPGRRRGCRPRQRRAESPGRRRASSGPRRSTASCRARQSRRAARRGSSARRPSARGRSAADGSTR